MPSAVTTRCVSFRAVRAVLFGPIHSGNVPSKLHSSTTVVPTSAFMANETCKTEKNKIDNKHHVNTSVSFEFLDVLLFYTTIRPLKITLCLVPGCVKVQFYLQRVAVRCGTESSLGLLCFFVEETLSLLFSTGCSQVQIPA